MSNALARLSTHPRIALIAMMVACVLALPSIFGGYIGDDYLHQWQMIEPAARPDAPATAYGQFAFFDGELEHTRDLMERGVLPWWSDERLRVWFWRPLTELSHALDHAVAPRSPVFAHLHSVGWLALMVLVYAGLLRRFGTPARAAGLALIAFALDDAHAMPVAWIANRNALIATTLGLWSLTAHVRGHREGWRPGAWLGPLAFALALMAKESAVSLLAYVLAYQLIFGNTRTKLRAVAPYLLVGAVYLLTYRSLGYGVRRSSSYIDPISSPLDFLSHAPERAIAMVAAQFSPFFPEPLAFAPFGLRMIMLGFAGLITAAVVRYVIAPRWSDPAIRFWTLGMLGSLIPALIPWPSTRTLMMTGVGGFALLGHLVSDWLTREPPVRRIHRFARGVVLVSHFVFAPLALAGMCTGMSAMMNDIVPREQIEVMPGTKRNTWILVNWTHPLLSSILIPPARLADGHPAPRMRALISGVFGAKLERVDARCLDVTGPRGYFLGLDQLALARAGAMEVGWRRELSDLTIEVRSRVPDGRPETVRFCFSKPIEALGYHWIAAHGRELREFTPPEVGDTVELAPTR